MSAVSTACNTLPHGHLLERIAELEAERDVLKLDAQRYQKVRTCKADGWLIGKLDRRSDCIIWVLGTEADAAIDAAKG